LPDQWDYETGPFSPLQREMENHTVPDPEDKEKLADLVVKLPGAATSSISD
jgi:hypothetical protein